MLCRSTLVSAVIDPGATGELDALRDVEFVKAHTGIGPLELAFREMLLLPGCDLLRRRAIPQCPAIYFITEGWELQYIGSAIKLHKRINDHVRGRRWLPGAWVRWLEWQWIEPIPLRLAEQRLIRTLQPNLNIQNK